METINLNIEKGLGKGAKEQLLEVIESFVDLSYSERHAEKDFHRTV